MPVMSVPFTDRLLASLRVRDGETRTVYWEPSRRGVGALGMRVSSTFKVFVYQYWKDGKSRMMTVGRYPQMSLAEAHKAVSEAMLHRERGADPAADQVAENIRQRTAPTVADLAVEYLEKHAKPKKKSWAEDERILNHDVLPVLGKRRIEEVKRREIVGMLDNIVLRGAPIAANRCLAVTRKMFNFAVKRGLLEHSPCTMMDMPAKSQRRERLLDVDELRLFLAGLPEIPVWTPTAMALLVELLTAQRSGEVVAMQWADVDLQEGLWTIPAAKAKNGKSHLVPLSAPVVRLLRAAKRVDMGHGAVFPSRDDGQPMVQTATARAVYRHHGKLAKARFSPHDLRRTAATHMASIGVPRLVLAKVLNHTDSAMTGIYDRYTYQAEKKDALDRWVGLLETLGLEEAIGKLEGKVAWQTEGKWWGKRVERLGGDSS
jgi:integrase